MKKNFIYVIGLTILVGGFLYVSSLEKEVTSTSEKVIKHVTFDEGVQVIAGNPSMVILDVRTPEEYAQGHLAGAINVNVESGTFDEEISKLDKNTSYFVYCRSGRRSAVAVSRMKDLSFSSTYNLLGGIQSINPTSLVR
ncbi:MAG: hypothetical protein QG653_232 [Patescibacteria group bacterium]|nr:hypothetical protein [Patescibacteria group bacterium]